MNSITTRSNKIEIEGVSKIYRSRSGVETLALDQVDLEVQEGELICLLGQSGCGKSTILNMIAGLVEPTKGRIEIEGRRVEGPGSDRSVVFQKHFLLPWLSVEKNVRLGLEIQGHHKGADQRVAEHLELVELSARKWKKRPHELSGGEAQRVAIARALVCNPSVVLFDEPFSALDTRIRERLQGSLLHIWNDRRYTMLFVTHDIEEAVFLATRIVIMSPGPGKIERLYQNSLGRPRDRGSAEFFRLARMIRADFDALAKPNLQGAH